MDSITEETSSSASDSESLKPEIYPARGDGLRIVFRTGTSSDRNDWDLKEWFKLVVLGVGGTADEAFDEG
jgi:hypothetical protein